MRSVLVTGVGGGVGQSILKALQGSRYRTVGVDSEAVAAGLHAVPRAYKGLYAKDPRFVDRLMEICLAEGCGLIFPGHDAELIPLSMQADRLRAEGVIPIVSSERVVRMCDDKLATQEFLADLGLPVLETRNLGEVTEFGGPVVLKPRRGGARSRATYVARSAKEFAAYRQLVDPDNCVVQEYVEGDEYTCGSVTLDGVCQGVIAMRRILRDGDTYKAFVEHPSPLDSAVRTIVEALKPFGGCNVQLRVRNGKPYVFEINARCSGTTAARALAGFNEPKIVADFLFDGSLPEPTIREIGILRYWKELVVLPERIEKLQKVGVLSGDGMQL